MGNKVVYIHKRLDKDEVFYVGIGSIKRAFTKHGRNRLWKIIEKKSGGFEVEILYDNLTIEEAKEIEKKLILEYGRIELRNGTLANLTDGADGTYNISEETRKLMSDFRKGFLVGEKNGRYGMPVSEETRKKISDALTGKPLSDETKKKLSEALKGREVSDETRKKLSELNKGVAKTDEHKKKLCNEKRTKNSGKGINKRHNRYRVNIRIGNCNRIELGSFETYEEALEARLKAEDKYWGTNHYPPPESNEPVS